MTDPDTGERSPDAAEPAAPADPTRRTFFRRFAGDVIEAAASVVGAAQTLQRSSAEAAAAILDPQEAERRALPPEDTAASVGQPAGGGFRTPFRFAGGASDVLLLIDQRRLPDEVVEVEVRSAAEAARAIRDMVVRGAPAIGQVAAIGLSLTAGHATLSAPHVRRATLRGAASALTNARPTAINLAAGVDRLMTRYRAIGELSEDGHSIATAMREEADAIVFEATTDHGRLAEAGAGLLPHGADGTTINILTHCNTGPLACGQFGTALGVVQVAHHAGRDLHVWVDETRPYLQGARLTTWELEQAGVPHTLIADVAAGSIIAAGEVDAILVGADRIAANGDTANKLGTYPLAVLAARHQVPFYVCAPLSSVDLGTPDGDEIPIEERPGQEVLELGGIRIAPATTAARNPGFDVTPASLISAIVTEEGVLRAPFGPALVAAMAAREDRRAREAFGAERQARSGAPAAPPATDSGPRVEQPA